VLVDWTPFYVAMAGASATVMGLLFVAVQLSAERIPAHRRARWWSIAFSTFYMYLTTFFLPVWFLIPSLGPHSRPSVTCILAAIGILRVVRTAFSTWHGFFQGQAEPWWQRVWYLAGPLILYLLLAYYAGKAYLGEPQSTPDESVAILLVLVFSLALKNSWSLLVEGAFPKNTLRDK
jgi:hypothetical protein